MYSLSAGYTLSVSCDGQIKCITRSEDWTQMNVLCVENSTLLVRKRHSVGIPSEESFIISVVDVAANKEVTVPMVHIG